jgi:DNA adenine methylase
MKSTKDKTKPFLKWVGGKTQLLDQLESRLPQRVRKTGIIERYIEPFVGGGALFFYLKGKYKIKKAYLIDTNEDLILTYKVIKKEPKSLIKVLGGIESRYLKKNENERAKYYYRIRDRYNKQKDKINYRKLDKLWMKQAAYLLFLNKTCFNGLFRQNRQGKFNVPHGRYKNPKICNEDNLIKVNSALKNTKVICGDFSRCEKYAKPETLIYFDPPYRPINITSNFTSYTRNGFCDKEQVRLAKLSRELSEKGVYVLLSNSDPTNGSKQDNFFHKIYNNFQIKRVFANRMVNCNGDRRGRVKELLIANY